MKCLLLIMLLLFSRLPLAQTKTELERINFLPKADAFAIFRYQYNLLNIDTPQATVMTKEVNNYSNGLSASYAHRFSKRYFVGVKGSFEQSSENAIRYGIPLRRRFTSQGFHEPEAFLLARLRPQSENHGLIDFFMSFSPKGGAREIKKNTATTLNGRSIFNASVSHGALEEEWEFRTALGYTYYGKGEEENDFTANEYVLQDYSDFKLDFTVQYESNDWLFFYGSIGIHYRGTQNITDRASEKREIRAGTGSIFLAGLKKPLGDWTVIDANYSLKRNDYFIKGPTSNFDGEETNQEFNLSLLQAF